MKTHKRSDSENRNYKIMLLCFGKAIIKAGSQEEAAEKACYLEDEEIEWLSEKDGIPGGRLVTLIELQEDIV